MLILIPLFPALILEFFGIALIVNYGYLEVFFPYWRIIFIMIIHY